MGQTTACFSLPYQTSNGHPDSPIVHLIREYHVGAVYLTWLNNGSIGDGLGKPPKVARLTNSLQQLACEDTRLSSIADCIPLLVAMDHEGDGYPRTHLRQGTTAIPSEMAIGATWNLADALMPSHIRYRGFQGDVSQLTKPISLDPEGMQAFMSLPPLADWRREGLVVADGLGVRALQAYDGQAILAPRGDRKPPARRPAKKARRGGGGL